MKNTRYKIETQTCVSWAHDVDDHPRRGWLSPNSEIYYHMIPKNASSYLSGIFDEWGWQQTTNLVDLHERKAICLIRDPMSRWISGITEFLYNINTTVEEIAASWPLLLRILKEQPNQDAHTTPQVDYLFGYKLDAFDYFFVSEAVTIGKPLYTWFSTNGYENKIDRYDRQNTIQSSALKVAIRDKIVSALKEDIELTARIKHYYSSDFELIDWIGRTKGWK